MLVFRLPVPIYVAGPTINTSMVCSLTLPAALLPHLVEAPLFACGGPRIRRLCPCGVIWKTTQGWRGSCNSSGYFRYGPYLCYVGNRTLLCLIEPT